MLKLNYIITKNLPNIQQKYLTQNLKNEIQQGICVLHMDDRELRLDDFPAEESLFVSNQKMWLHRAAAQGMATLGFLPLQSLSEVEMQQEATGRLQRENENELQADMYAEGMDEIDYVFLQHIYERHHHIPWTILETDRCVLREFSMADLDALFSLYAGKGMTDYMEPLYPYAEEKEYQQAYIEHMYRFFGYGMWLVCEKHSGTVIGRAGIEHREELEGALELGYAIGVPWQGQGYATEVCEAILAYVREQLDIEDVYCLIETENVKSRQLAEKLGFLWEQSRKIDGKIMQQYGLHIIK